ncbi:MAG: hypothetical protein MZV70_65915 [Desulfobacterales bacterium]|nr:hypothetical protein [Desulfobacterales bacterium]
MRPKRSSPVMLCAMRCSTWGKGKQPARCFQEGRRPHPGPQRSEDEARRFHCMVERKTRMVLYNHDSVQTFRDASAQITIDKKSSFTMGSNSLVIIKRMEKGPLSEREHRSAMVLLEGELRGRSLRGTTG